MGILEGKNILVAGVTMNTSIGYRVAELAQAEGATVIVSNFGRAMSLTARVLKRLDPMPPLIELDVSNDEHLATLADRLREHVDHLDGVVHSIAFANPETALGGAFLTTGFGDVGTSLQVSAYSLVSLTMACKPLFGDTASVVGLTFDARYSWPAYDWMGVSKAALESASRYLARYLGPEGVRSNLVAAGPLETIAKKAIPGAESFNDIWSERAPLGWDPRDTTPTAKAVVALLSDWFPATTGEMLHVDGGLHSTGA
ncbi:MAG: enoyl-ACP reductase FabI [Propionicimonas sp.]|uniref:enoyl-ACP reductase FabI n=1 Tax=Propionicimonas sp. TaxID=1955623 RepID=UPI002B219955|nr:enoyl-ACP reductase FabI [Propionicimonas sp.]MEA4942939.1 enoyl-ACP reductase FabI [Propionicimonas sp.]MEA5119547.1 enoyl-ACP reductase FabI [Propionicimonas sp.]